MYRQMNHEMPMDMMMPQLPMYPMGYPGMYNPAMNMLYILQDIQRIVHMNHHELMQIRKMLENMDH
ncbi:MAG: hypothetical protein ACOWWO_15320 [Peptococcaceae bacterium]